MFSFLSPEGRSFTFDDRASGYGRGEGVAAVIIKPLKLALADGDPIRAIARASYCNQDGRTPGITMPSQQAQMDLIRGAYESAGLSMADTIYCEAHGTGTAAGDPVEVSAIGSTIAKCLREKRGGRTLVIGAAKSNIGHLESCANLAGLIKVVMMLEKGWIVPNYDFQRPNPEIDLKGLNLEVATHLQPLANPSAIFLRASVNAFGYGGTNAHVILDDARGYLGAHQLEEYLERLPPMNGDDGHDGINNHNGLNGHNGGDGHNEIKGHDGDDGHNGINGHDGIDGHEGLNGQNGIDGRNERDGHNGLSDHSGSSEDGEVPADKTRIFMLSAKTARALAARKKAIASYVQDHTRSRLDLDSLAFTLNTRRTHFLHRDYVVASTQDDLVHALRGPAPAKSATAASVGGSVPRVAFCFTGQGAQWAQMGVDLIEHSPHFRHSLEQCEAVVTELGASWSLREELRASADVTRVNEAELSQPLCTAIQIGLVDMLSVVAIKPDVVFGHSSGEIAAGYASGALSLYGAMKIAYFRGVCASRIKATAAPTQLQGAMLAVGLSQDAVETYLDVVPSKLGQIVIACVNSSSSVTLSGDVAAVEYVHKRLTEGGHFARRLRVDIAYHSPHMQRIAQAYHEALGDLKTHEFNSTTTFVSSVHAMVIESSSLLDAAYWVSNLVSQVQFSAAVETLVQDVINHKEEWHKVLIMELGPHPALSGPMRQTLQEVAAPELDYQILPSLVRNSSSTHSIFSLIGSVFCARGTLDLSAAQLGGDTLKGKLLPRVLTDLPSYPWDHSVQYWHESRISAEYRLRTRPKHPLLGVPSIDFDHLQPSWRHIIRTTELPYLRGHVIQSDILYPAGGFVAAVLQACYEHWLALGHIHPIERYVLEDVLIKQALPIADDGAGVEMKTILFPRFKMTQGMKTRDLQYNFVIRSCTVDGQWSEHCEGSARMLLSDGSGTTTTTTRQQTTSQKLQAFHKAEAEIPTWVRRTKQNLYADLRGIGYFYDGAFQALDEVFTKPNHAFAMLSIPETSRFMPMEYEPPQTLHPATIDGFFQAPLCALFEADQLRNTMVPQRLGRLEVDARIHHTAGVKLLISTSAVLKGHRSCDVEFHVKNEAWPNDILVSGADIEYIGLGSWQDAQVQQDRAALCNRFETGPVVRFLRPREFQRLLEVDDSNQVNGTVNTGALENAALSYIRTALEALQSWKPTNETPHHLMKLFESFKDAHATRGGVQKSCDIQPVSKALVNGNLHLPTAMEELVHRVGPRLAEIIMGTQDPNALLQQDDLLDRALHEHRGLQKCQQSVQRIVEALLFEQPKLRVLEYGNMIAEPSRYLADILSSPDVTYDYTGHPSGFFSIASSHDATGHIHLRRMNIEDKESDGEGYGDRKYDLVVLSSSLHLCASIDKALSNIRRLLNPHGVLVILDVLEPQLYLDMVMGTLPQWWRAQENHRQGSPVLDLHGLDCALKQNGFSGAVLKSAPESISASATTPYGVVATCVEPTTGSGGPQYRVHLLATSSAIPVEDSLVEAVKTQTLLDVEQSTFDIAGQAGCVYVIFDDGPEGLLENPTSGAFAAMKRIVASAQGIIWLTRRTDVTLSDAPLPSSGVVGLARVVRTEYPLLPFLTVELGSDPAGYEMRRVDAVVKMLKHLQTITAISTEAGSSLDSEFSEEEGALCVTRLLAHEHASKFVSGDTERQLERRSEMHDDSSLGIKRLTMATAGQLGTLCWEAIEGSSTPSLLPGPEELAIEARAFGVTPGDLRTALVDGGHRSWLGAFSGVVTAIGSSLHGQFHLGDHVLGYLPVGFTTRAVVNAAAVRKTLLPFEEAAAIPGLYTSIAYALTSVAKVRAGELVVVSIESGLIKDFAVQYAKYLGARVFIFDDSETLTDEQGIDIILWHQYAGNSAGPRCRDLRSRLRSGGRIIDISSFDNSEESAPATELAAGSKNVTFISIDWNDLVVSSVGLAGGHLLDEALMAVEALGIDIPMSSRSWADVFTAFRSLQHDSSSANHILRVEAHKEVPVVDATRPFRLVPDVTYLLAGGMGGLGRAIVAWMYEHGARNFALMSRSTPMDGSKEAEWLRIINARGCNVQLFTCDISSADEVQRALGIIGSKMLPIGGVIQSAMVLRDAIFENMTEKAWAATVEAKMQGSLNLHRLVAQQKQLGFFIMLSSVAGIVGNAGQANYAAGCAFQDALARYRIAQGLQATSLDLGMIQTAGYLENNVHVAESLLKQGFRPVKLEHVFRLLRFAMQDQAQHSQIAIGIQYDYTSGSGNNTAKRPEFLRDARFRHLVRLSDSAISHNVAHTSIKDSLRAAASPQEAHAMVTEALLRLLADKIGVSREDVGNDQSFIDLGVDSLVAVEIRTFVIRELESEISTAELLGSDSISSQAERVVTRRKKVNI